RPVVRGLDADADIGVGQYRRGRQLRVHRVDVLLERPGHAQIHDVDIGKDARLCQVDHGAFEVEKVSGPGCPRVHHRGHAGPEAGPIGHHAPPVGVTRVVAMDVDVEGAGGHVEARDIHHAFGRSGVDVGRDGCDLSVCNRYVHRAIDLV